MYSGYRSADFPFAYGAFTLSGRLSQNLSARIVESIMRSEPRSARTPVWPLSISLAATLEIDKFSFSSSPYLDVSVQAVPLHTLWIHVWMHELLHADCSIRKSADQSLLTAPRSLSQLTTSFFGSQCQGIHSALFFALPFVLYGSSQNFRFLTRCSFLPDILVFTFMSFLLTRSFTLHFCFFMFCFQAAFFCPFPRTDINRQLLIYWYLLLQQDICSLKLFPIFLK